MGGGGEATDTGFEEALRGDGECDEAIKVACLSWSIPAVESVEPYATTSVSPIGGVKADVERPLLHWLVSQ